MNTLTTFSLLDEMDSLFGRGTVARNWPSYDERGFNPPVDVVEDADHFLMSFDLPGIRKEDLKIEASGNLLTVSGEKRREWQSDEAKKTQRFERTYGYFKRSFTLPASIEAQKIEANYKDGVLSLYLPKAHTTKARQIEIQTESNGFFSKLLNSNKD